MDTQESHSPPVSILAQWPESTLPPLSPWPSPPSSPPQAPAPTVDATKLSRKLALSASADEYVPSSIDGRSVKGDLHSGRGSSSQQSASSFDIPVQDSSEGKERSTDGSSRPVRPLPLRPLAPAFALGHSASAAHALSGAAAPTTRLSTTLKPVAPPFTPSSAVFRSPPTPVELSNGTSDWISKCQKEVTTYQGLVHDSEITVRAQKREIKVMQAELAGAQDQNQLQLQQHRSKLTQLQARIDVQDQKIEAQEQEIKATNMSVSSREELRAELERIVKERDAAVLRATRLKTDLTYEHSASRNERKQFESLLEQEREKLGRAEQEKVELQKRLDESVTELVRLEDSQIAASDASAELHTTRIALSLAETSLDKERNTVQQLLTQMMEADKRVKGKEVAFEREKASIVATARDEVERMKKERDAIKMTLQLEQDVEKNEAEARIQQESKKREQFEQELRGAKEEQRRTRAQLTAQVAEVRAQLEDEVQKRERMTQEMERMRTAEKTATTHSDLKMRLVDVETQNEHLTAELTEAHDIIDSLLSEVNDLKDMIKRAEADRSSSSSPGRDVSRTKAERLDRSRTGSTPSNSSRYVARSTSPSQTRSATASTSNKSWRNPEPGVSIKHQKELPKPIKLSSRYEGLKVEG